MSRLAAAVRALPRRAVSRAVGALARTGLPRPLLAPALALYARAYGCHLAEAAPPPGGYGSFLAFFTRRLAVGARPMPPDPAAVAAPADGRVSAAGLVARGSVLQAKGVPYRVGDLLADEALARTLEGGTFVATYLAPGDYHRFHWPFDATVETVRHLPGDLWPVHPGAVASVPGLFVRNERVVLAGHLESRAAFALVAVGALNVGSIRLAALPVRTNRGGPAVPRTWADLRLAVARGQEAGWFEMGSALILLLGAAGGRLEPLAAGARLRVGGRIGTLSAAGS